MTTKPCPTCGAELTASLVDAIANPTREESCPQRPPATERPAPVTVGRLTTLGAYMLAGSIMRSVATR